MYGTNAELIARQLADAADVKRIWGGLMYVVTNYGIVGDGVTNNTSALQALINEAIAAGRRTIFFPHGVYFVESLINADQVDFVGDNSTFTGGYSGEIANLGSDAALKADLEAHEALTAASPIKPHGIGSAAAQSYEEGVFTPSIAGLSVHGNNTYISRVGRYTKVGRIVFFTVYIRIAVKDPAMAGAYVLTGLPFVSSVAVDSFTPISFGSIRNITVPSGGLTLMGYVSPGTADVIFRFSSNASAMISVDSSHITNDSEFLLSGTYFT